MSTQPKRPFFGAQYQTSRAVTSSFKDLDGVIIDFMLISYKISSGCIVNKRRDVYAKVVTERIDGITYAAVDYIYLDRLVKAVRSARMIGEGSCSVIDECYTDQELKESIRKKGITEIAETMQHFQEIHKGYHAHQEELEAATQI